MTPSSQSITLAVQQRVLPEYRAAFFDTLASQCPGEVNVFAGFPLKKEAISSVSSLARAKLTLANNRYLLDPASPWFLCWQNGLSAWLKAAQPNALVVEANPRYWSTPPAVRWMHARKRPVLGWGLGAPSQGLGLVSQLRRLERANFLSKLDGVIAYSQQGAAEYMKAGFPAERVFVAVNAVAPRPANPPPERRLPLDSPPDLLFVGRLQERKRLDLLFRACSALPLELQPRLTVVGDGPARAEFEAAARQLYPATRFTGALFGVDLQACFAAADLFVLPGTGGLAVQQAMAAGLPVVVAEGDGTQDDLVRPATGWSVQPGSLDSLRTALLDALSDMPRLRRMGLEAYRVVAQEVNLEAMAAAFLNAVEHVIMLGLR